MDVQTEGFFLGAYLKMDDIFFTVSRSSAPGNDSPSRQVGEQRRWWKLRPVGEGMRSLLTTNLTQSMNTIYYVNVISSLWRNSIISITCVTYLLVIQMV